MQPDSRAATGAAPREKLPRAPPGDKLGADSPRRRAGPGCGLGGRSAALPGGRRARRPASSRLLGAPQHWLGRALRGCAAAAAAAGRRCKLLGLVHCSSARTQAVAAAAAPVESAILAQLAHSPHRAAAPICPAHTPPTTRSLAPARAALAPREAECRWGAPPERGERPLGAAPGRAPVRRAELAGAAGRRRPGLQGELELAAQGEGSRRRRVSLRPSGRAWNGEGRGALCA